MQVLHIQDKIYRCDSLALENLGFNSLFKLSISIQTEESIQLLHRQTVKINLNHLTPNYLWGYVNAYQVLRKKGGLHFYNIQINSELCLLTHFEGCVQFDNCELQTLLELILNKHDISFRIEFQKSHPPIEFISQYNESDFDFLMRVCAHYGIIFYHRFNEDRYDIVFTDMNPQNTPHHLSFNPNNKLVSNEAHAFKIKQYHNQLAQSTKLLDSHLFDRKTYEVQLDNTTHLKSSGQVFLNYQLPFVSPEHQLSFITLLQQQLDCQREVIWIEAVNITYQVGDIIILDGDNLLGKDKSFIIISIFSSMSEAPSKAKPLIFHLWVIPAHCQYKMPINPLKHKNHNIHNWPLSFSYQLSVVQCQFELAKIHASQVSPKTNTHEYKVKSIFFDYQNTYRYQWIPSIHFASGAHSQELVSLPLPKDCLVVLGFTHNLREKAIIMGAYPNYENNLPTRHFLNNENFLYSRGDTNIIMSESHNNQTLKLQCHDTDNFFLMQQTSDESTIRFNTSGQANFQAGKTFGIQTGKNINFHMGHMQTHSNQTITLQTQKSMSWTAKMTIYFKSSELMGLKVDEGNCMIYAEKYIRFNSEKIALSAIKTKIKAPLIKMKTHQNMHFKGESINFQTGFSRLRMSHGTIYINGADAQIIAPMLIHSESL